MSESFLDGRVTLHCGDCLDVLRTLPENSIDACITDPPYHLTSIVKRFGADNAAPSRSNGATGVYARSSAGFMGKKWDGGDIAFQADTWREILRVLKPGGHLLAMGGTRTYHRLACAIEDAGFDVRDMVAWVYSVGFPKSHNVSKAIDKEAGAEREVVGRSQNGIASGSKQLAGQDGAWGFNGEFNITVPATDAAKQLEGFGTALKPSLEIVGCYQKPLTVVGYCEILLSNLTERIDTCRQNASDAAKSSEPIRAGSSVEKEDSVPASAATQHEDRSARKIQTGAADATISKADTSESTSELGSTALNTLLSWSNTLAAVYEAAKTSTTSTAFETIIDWRILNFCLSPTMLESTLEGVCLPSGASADALRAARFSIACFGCLNGILTLSAAAHAMSPEAEACLGVGAKQNLDPCVLARKPLSESTIAANVLRWGTGALNIDGCRVPVNPEIDDQRLGGRGKWTTTKAQSGNTVTLPRGTVGSSSLGRWPANLVHDGSEEVVGAFPQSKAGIENKPRGHGGMWSGISNAPCGPQYGDSGSAARFFASFPQNCASNRFHYSAKASSSERAASKHPTVKPVSLMQWLVRLVTPPGGTVIDPFAGTGTTAEAAYREGFHAIVIEREAEYQADIRRRMAMVKSGVGEREREQAKTHGKIDDAGPLFGARLED